MLSVLTAAHLSMTWSLWKFEVDQSIADQNRFGALQGLSKGVENWHAEQRLPNKVNLRQNRGVYERV